MSMLLYLCGSINDWLIEVVEYRVGLVSANMQIPSVGSAWHVINFTELYDFRVLLGTW